MNLVAAVSAQEIDLDFVPIHVTASVGGKLRQYNEATII